MDVEALAKAIWGQFVTVWNAPVPFIAAVLLAAWLIWRFVKGQYETRLANSDSTISMLEKRLDRRETEETIAIAATKPSSVKQRVARAHPALKPPVGSDVTPKSLIEMFRGPTEIQAKPLKEKYLGGQLTVTGEVNDAMDGFVLGGVMVVVNSDNALVFCQFGKTTNQIAALRKGDEIAIEGVISDISSLGVYLENCRIL